MVTAIYTYTYNIIRACSINRQKQIDCRNTFKKYKILKTTKDLLNK